MLKRVHSEHDEIVRRLRVEAAPARVEPPARLRGRTLAALRDVSLEAPRHEPHGRLARSHRTQQRVRVDAGVPAIIEEVGGILGRHARDPVPIL